MMQSDTYHFNVGAFECMAIGDGAFTYAPPMFPPPAMLHFSNAPKEQLEQALIEHNLHPEKWTSWTSPYTCLLVNTGEQLVLVDTGGGALAPQVGHLVEHLQVQGIGPGDIDTVIITHCHPDHINGITLDNGSLAFPKARYAIQKQEWNFWTSEQAEQKLPAHTRDILLGIARRNLSQIQGRLDLIEGERDILRGIHAIPAPGHTPGHVALSITSKGEQLLNISDTVLHPIHLEHPDWHAVVDLVPEKAETTRRRILHLAATENLLVMAFHFPFPGLGYVKKKGEKWQWKPIEIEK
jgi:glyoxylase-like metal-dependent hydrolase (beta-lactamase superfamily II)